MMVVGSRLVFAIFLGNCLCLLLLCTLIDANQADVDCLRTFKSQVEDPNGYLSSWVFGNETAGYISNNQFTGQLPPELVKLGRLKTFSVANNRLSGPIPTFNSTSINSENFANNTGFCVVSLWMNVRVLLESGAAIVQKKPIRR
ncbi:Leucine-rich repeat-containing N-terminal plant-type [Arabidopsis suecica]|uniref:Leucine-rich repeat-containing N-terminal plant-type n=1 Tax=Arabidopsis suecica TaxID=45249 RepID=A0A8T1XQZ2_ARASU|nr:Leucine-rich repeat-containing N-terminal plant-type [Arabidopsis suecica]